jgi:hypothetical protein
MPLHKSERLRDQRHKSIVELGTPMIDRSEASSHIRYSQLSIVFLLCTLLSIVLLEKFSEGSKIWFKIGASCRHAIVQICVRGLYLPVEMGAR